MIVRTTHTTLYKYSNEVFIEPHTVRLVPKSNNAQRLIDFDLTITPEPDGKAHIVDLSGNDAVCIWYAGLHDHMTIRAESVVETLRKNPFDYIITDESVATLPAEYLNYHSASLLHYRTRNSKPGGEVDDFVDSIKDEADGDTQSFLSVLNSRIYSDFEQTVRHDGAPYPPEVTLLTGTATCRDFAVLFIEACRTVGLAARFVSGYRVVEDEAADRQLHAWAEVYLPGGGWRGYDPSEGLAVADGHIALASGIIPADAAPVAGSFRRTGATVEMEFEIDVSIQ